MEALIGSAVNFTLISDITGFTAIIVIVLGFMVFKAVDLSDKIHKKYLKDKHIDKD